jgi:hypothetical protein
MQSSQSAAKNWSWGGNKTEERDKPRYLSLPSVENVIHLLEALSNSVIMFSYLGNNKHRTPKVIFQQPIFKTGGELMCLLPSFLGCKGEATDKTVTITQPAPNRYNKLLFSGDIFLSLFFLKNSFSLLLLFILSLF